MVLISIERKRGSGCYMKHCTLLSLNLVRKLVNASAKVEYTSSVMCFDVVPDELSAWNSALRFIEHSSALLPKDLENYWQFLIDLFFNKKSSYFMFDSFLKRKLLFDEKSLNLKFDFKNFIKI